MHAHAHTCTHSLTYLQKPPIALAVDTIIIAYSIAIEFRLGFQQQQICNVAATAAADIRVKSITNTQPPELATLIYLYG